MTIRAAIARAGEPLRIEACELSAPGPGEVRVRVEACGICHSDLLAHAGVFGTPLPAVLGHEGVGRIVEVGPGVVDRRVSERVLMSFGACGACASCLGGAPAYCEHALALNRDGRRLDGPPPITLAGEPLTSHFFAQSSFATEAVARATNLVPLDDDVPSALAAPLACGVQTGASSVVNVLSAGQDDALAVLGCGTLGLAAIMAAAVVGCRRIVAVDLREPRLALARDLGATDTLDPASDDVARSLRKLGITRALDSTGQPAIVEAALSALRPRGVLACAAVGAPGSRVSLDATALMAFGRTIRGTVEGDAVPARFVPRMLAWWREGRFPLERLVATYAFDDIARAVDDLRAARVVKPVLLMPS